MELIKLSHFKPIYITTKNRQYHVYIVKEAVKNVTKPLHRAFLRGFIRQMGNTSEYMAATCTEIKSEIAKAFIGEVEESLKTCLNELLEIQNSATEAIEIDWTHIFLYILPVIPLLDNNLKDIYKALENACANVIQKNGELFRHAKVAQWVLRLTVSEKYICIYIYIFLLKNLNLNLIKR